MADARTSFGDRAGLPYWNEAWQREPLPESFDPYRPGLDNHVNREFDRFLRRWLGPHPRGNGRLLELGCARSVWLPYFARDMGYSVTGIDYSDLGCEQARKILGRVGVGGEIVCTNFFDPPQRLVDHFDVVISFGVAEHFDDTAGCIAAFARYVATGGYLVTVVPNMTGLPGFIQRNINEPVFRKHVPLDHVRLADAHRRSGLQVLDSGSLVSTNFGILNLTGLPFGTPSWHAKRVLLALLWRASLVGWFVEEHVARLRASAFTAGYVYCVATRQGRDLPPPREPRTSS